MSITETMKKYILSSYERETIINFNEDEQTASVYTCSKVWMKKLDSLCVEFPELYKLKRQDEYSKTYEAPKRYVRIGKPQPNKARDNAASRFAPR